MARSLLGGARRGRWNWAPLACGRFSLGVTELYFVRLTVLSPKVVDCWNQKRAMSGVYNIKILGNFEKPPKELIKGPRWLRGWKGNELQQKMTGNQMFTDDLHNLKKRIRILYKHFNLRGTYR